METNFDRIQGQLAAFLAAISFPPGALLWFGIDSGAVWAIVAGSLLVSPGLLGWLIFALACLANQAKKEDCGHLGS